MTKPCKCLLLIFSFILHHFPLSAQNLIPNPSFEYFRKCPKKLGEIAKSEAWSSPNGGTPDYFNGCVKRDGQNGPGVPANFISIQPAFEGQAYAGIFRGENECEYLQVALTSPLEAEKRYCLRFFASPASWKVEGLNAIQAWFRTGALSEDSWTPLEADGQAHKVIVEALATEASWALMSVSFVAKGGEDHLLVGYFGDADGKIYTFLDDFALYEYESVDGCRGEYFSGNAINDQNNLVPNPGFELKWGCPGKREELHLAKSWVVAEQTPDFYHRCGSGTAGVPNNQLGQQEPHSGEGYGGFWAYLAKRGDYREFITVRLNRPLEPGEVYCLSMWVSRSDKSDHALSDLQMLASRFKEKYWSQTPVNDPRIVFLRGEKALLTDTEEWMEISAAFRANGGEKFLTIGNFRKNDDPELVKVRSGAEGEFAYPSLSVNDHLYYYVDDVGVYEIDNALSPCTQDMIVQTMGEIDPVSLELEDTLSLPLPAEVPDWKAGDTLVLEHFLFAFDSRELEKAATPILDTLAAYLERHPELELEISGHTDDQGAAAYNQKLSQGRAEAVLRYLVGVGLAAERMTAEGKGESEPLVSNDSEECRAKNRRVAIRFVQK